jgi:hypothetical protein
MNCLPLVVGFAPLLRPPWDSRTHARSLTADQAGLERWPSRDACFRISQRAICGQHHLGQIGPVSGLRSLGGALSRCSWATADATISRSSLAITLPSSRHDYRNSLKLREWWRRHYRMPKCFSDQLVDSRVRTWIDSHRVQAA